MKSKFQLLVFGIIAVLMSLHFEIEALNLDNCSNSNSSSSLISLIHHNFSSSHDDIYTKDGSTLMVKIEKKNHPIFFLFNENIPSYSIVVGCWQPPKAIIM